MPSPILAMGAPVSSGSGTGKFDPYAKTRHPRGSLSDRKKLQQKLKPHPKDGKRRFKNNINGNSMHPKYKHGDEAVTDTDFPFENLQEGDDVTFVHDNGDGTESYYTHEITDINLDGSLETKGVNNQNPDRGSVTPSNYIGKTQSMESFLYR